MRAEYLKELELLPLWQLRKPLSHLAETPENVAQAVEESKDATAENVAPAEDASPNVVTFVSEDSHLQLMHASDGLNKDAQQLLQNIASSMRLKRHPSAPLGAALQQASAVFLVMGESLAQSVLSSQQSLQGLRGQAHTLGAKQVVVTDELQTMLDNPETKAQVWKDCCLAMSLLSEN